MMLFIQLAVVLLFIFLGARKGGLGIAYAGGAGVIVLGLLGCKVDPGTGIPWDVIGVIISVISCVAAMEVAGGLELLVMLSERILRHNPKRITFLAPTVTFFMTVLCGTGHVAFATLPVIAEVAKEQKVRPSRPLSIAAVASQIGICASPISAAMVAMAAIVGPLGVSYPKLVLVSIVGGYVGSMIGAVVSSLIIFVVSLVVVMAYAAAITAVDKPPLPRGAAIMTFMMTAALVIATLCKVPLNEITSQATYKSGTSAAICVMGVAWLGNTFVSSNIDTIKAAGSGVIHSAPWLLFVVLFLAASLLYSQAATTVTFMPVAAALGLPASVLVGCFAAASALFLLPTYPTVVAAVEMDDTGTTRIGKYIFNHSFLIPGIVSISAACLASYGVMLVVG
ncbi:MAG: anaerobic C4-dicarboxylate transporter [Cutibacterium acnes]|nr:anaerobic C4-dicarboxylate transporter [Cutibacterium acnes]